MEASPRPLTTAPAANAAPTSTKLTTTEPTHRPAGDGYISNAVYTIVNAAKLAAANVVLRWRAWLNGRKTPAVSETTLPPQSPEHASQGVTSVGQGMTAHPGGMTSAVPVTATPLHHETAQEIKEHPAVSTGAKIKNALVSVVEHVKEEAAAVSSSAAKHPEAAKELEDFVREEHAAQAHMPDAQGSSMQAWKA